MLLFILKQKNIFSIFLFICAISNIQCKKKMNKKVFSKYIQHSVILDRTLSFQDYDTADILILTGQSNAIGQNDSSKMFDILPIMFSQPQPNVLIGRIGNASKTSEPFHFEPMQVPINTRDKYYNDSLCPYFYITGWGVEQNWAYLTQQHFNKKIYIIKSAFGGLGIINWQKPNGIMYQELSNMIDDACTVLISQNKTIRFRGIVWMQGESDVNTSNYYSLLDSTFTWIRKQRTELNNTPIIMVKIPKSNLFLSQYANQSFDSMQIKNPQLNFVINPDDWPVINQFDYIHFDNYSKLKLGELIYNFQLSHHQLD